MKREAEAHAQEDEERRSGVEAKNTAESNIYEIEKNLDTYKDELTAEEKEEISKNIASCRQAISTNSKDTISSALKTLQDHCSKVFESAYRRKSEKTSGSSSQKPENSETVEDEEFKDVGDKK